MKSQPDHAATDLFVDHFMPYATGEERADARANVDRLVAVLVQIDERLVREERETDSRGLEECGRVEASAV